MQTLFDLCYHRVNEVKGVIMTYTIDLTSKECNVCYDQKYVFVQCSCTVCICVWCQGRIGSVCPHCQRHVQLPWFSKVLKAYVWIKTFIGTMKLTLGVILRELRTQAQIEAEDKYLIQSLLECAMFSFVVFWATVLSVFTNQISIFCYYVLVVKSKLW